MRWPNSSGLNLAATVPSKAKLLPSPFLANVTGRDESRNTYLVEGEKVALLTLSDRLIREQKAEFPCVSRCKEVISPRHGCCEVHCGARETVGGSSVSSGCWGEDSNHENERALRHPRCNARSLFCELSNLPIHLPIISCNLTQDRISS
jgi:hypothetical protein